MNALPIIPLSFLLVLAPPDNEPAPRVLVCSKIVGFRQADAVAAGIPAFRELVAQAGFAVALTTSNLSRYWAVVFLYRSGMVLYERQKEAFQAFIHKGGGLVAAQQGVMTLKERPWNVSPGARVKLAGHPGPQRTGCRSEDREHLSTRDLRHSSVRTDESYNFDTNRCPHTHVLITVHESSYQGSTLGKDHPDSRYHEAEGRRGRCMAHRQTKNGCSESVLRQHFLGGIQCAAGLRAGATPAKAGRRGEGSPGNAVIRRVKSWSAARLDEPAVLVDREEYVRYAHNHAGDAARGRALFFNDKRAACARCHRANGQGADLGPDLSDVGGKYERALLIESLLDPSRQIVEGYRVTMVATTSGRILSGIVKGESDREITLVDAEGHKQVVSKGEISERKPIATSLMPDVIAAGLTPAQFADLVAYLQGLRSAGQGTPGSDTRGPITLPTGFSVEWVATGITGATALAIAPEGRAFICEQTGAVRVFKNGVLPTLQCVNSHA
jgi:putative heme-binding domain-containing protein